MGETSEQRSTVILGMPKDVAAPAHVDSKKLFRTVGLNTGNLAFALAVHQHLGANSARFKRLESPDVVNDSEGEVLVLPCANHLNPKTDLGGEATHFSNFKKPMVAIGLGAQAPIDQAGAVELSPGSVRWLRELAERAPTTAPNISVRGEFTRQVLEKYGVADRAVVLGCPSMFLGPHGIGSEIERALTRPIRRVAVAAGHPRWRHMRRIESSLARIVEETNGSYIPQGPLDMIRAARGEWNEIEPVARESLSQALYEGEVDQERLERWYREYSIVFFNAVDWMDYLRQFDLVVGPRFHGVMLAIQAGVPGLCIAHDSRIVELCNTMGVPYVLASEVSHGVTLDTLRRALAFDGSEFDRRRFDLAQDYVEFLGGNGVPARLPTGLPNETKH